MPYQGKPIIGIVGGIGSGKSFVAALFAELGCTVIDSDQVAHAVYESPDVIATVVGWYGPEVLDERGKISRRTLAHHVFRDAQQRSRLEALIHPRIHAEREREMAAKAGDPNVRAFVWDSPLLVEASLHTQCDAIVFVDVPYAERLRRVSESRGWDVDELDRREASQHPIEDKRRLASVVVDGTAEREVLREQLRGIVERLEK